MDLSHTPRVGPRSDERLRRDRYHRGTIAVGKRRARPEDAKWYGSAPMPVPETDRHWRPDSIKF